jgi:hypothetical protein
MDFVDPIEVRLFRPTLAAFKRNIDREKSYIGKLYYTYLQQFTKNIGVD